jgi:hypothetical protein
LESEHCWTHRDASGRSHFPEPGLSSKLVEVLEKATNQRLQQKHKTFRFVPHTVDATHPSDLHFNPRRVHGVFDTGQLIPSKPHAEEAVCEASPGHRLPDW